MKIALIGYGRMGREVEEAARLQQIPVVDRFTREKPLAAAANGGLEAGTVLVDFSVSSAVLANVAGAIERHRPLVIGTTGWRADLAEVRKLADAAGVGVVHGANFSIGMALFRRIVETAARTISPFAGYDPYLFETHHRAKLDRPSGTAIELSELVAASYDSPPTVESLRAGHAPGTHVVGFDSAVDSIRLEHVARSRRGFADGALLAARWIAGRQGFFDFQEVVDDVAATAKN